MDHTKATQWKINICVDIFKTEYDIILCWLFQQIEETKEKHCIKVEKTKKKKKHIKEKEKRYYKHTKKTSFPVSFAQSHPHPTHGQIRIVNHHSSS